jgi:hypothetical protein
MKKKPVAKPPPSAVVTPAKPEKPAEVNVAQQVASPAPGPSLLTPQQCWELLLRAARELDSLCEQEPGAVDCDRLYAVLNKCQNMLARNAALGCGNATAALAQHTLAGCETISELADAKKSIEAVKAVAAVNEFWPVMLRPGEKASKAAQGYLRAIGVGTRSVMPTVSKIPTDDVWANLVRPQIDKIRGCVFYLRGAVDAPEWQRAVDAWKLTARKWEKQVSALPPRLNSKTCGAWWELIREMLEDEWQNNPSARDELFNGQKSAAETSNRKTAKDFILEMAERKLKAIAATVEHPYDYRFISPPP